MTLREAGIAGAAGLLLCVASYGFGRYSQPAEVKTTDKKLTVEADHAKATDSLVTDSSSHVVEVVHKDTTTTTQPDGAKVVVNHDVVTREVVRTVFKDRVVTQEHETIKEVAVEHTKLVIAAKPQWRAGIDLGATLVGGSRLDLVPIPPPYSIVPIVYGAHVERRIAGPIWLGLHLDNTKTATLSASLEF